MRQLVIGVALFFAAQRSAWGGVIRVPEDYASVLAGVDAAVAGDSVLVGPGAWTDLETRIVVVFGAPLTIESAMFLKPGVTVIGVAGADQTILDSSGAHQASPATVEHAVAGVEPARLVGLTITGGGEGIAAVGGSPLEVESCRIVGNGLRGVLARETSLLLKDCLIAENELEESFLQGGVWGLDVNATCTGCTFEGNAGPGLHLSIAQWPGLTVVLRDCVFRDHSRRGAALNDVSSLEIERCTFFRNSTPVSTGGGLNLVRCSGAVRFSTFAFDSSGGNAGGLQVALSQVRVENNTFFGCYAATIGGALAVSGPDIGVVGNVFSNSTGRRGAVYKTGGPPNAETGCNLFWANADGDYFGDWIPAPTDIYADPLFCDPAILDFGLEAASPAAPPNSGVCGLIGAHEVTCGAISVESDSWGRIKNLYRSGPTSGEGVAR